MPVKKCPKILMTMTMMLTVTWNVPSAEGQNVFLPNTRNYVFAHLGKALMTADYGHIAIPINITSAAIYLDLLKSLVKHTNGVQAKMKRFQPDTSNMSKEEKEEADVAWKVAKSRLRVYADLMAEDFELAAHNFCQLSQYATDKGEVVCSVNRVPRTSKPSSPWTVDAISNFKYPKKLTEFDLFRTNSLPKIKNLNDEPFRYEDQFPSFPVNQSIADHLAEQQDVVTDKLRELQWQQRRQLEGQEAPLVGWGSKNYFSRPGTSDVLSRDKRQLLALGAALGFGMGGFSTIFGIFNYYQYSQLAGAVNDVNARQSKLIHLVEQQTEAIRANQIALDTLKKASKLALSISAENSMSLNFATVAIYSRHIVSGVMENTNLYVDIINAAMRGQVTQQMLSYDEAANGLQQVKELAKLQGLETIIDDPKMILQMTSGVVATEDGVTVLISIPLSRPEALLDVYRFRAFPLAINQDTHLLIDPERPILAINQDVHMEMSENDLQNCRIMNSIYVCTDKNILVKNSQASCLSSLYNNQHKVAADLCDMYVRPMHDVVLPMDDDSYLVYSLKPTSYDLRCSNGTRINSRQLLHLSQIKVPTGCMADLPHHKIYSRSELQVTKPAETYHWRIPVEELFGDTDLKEVDQIMKEIAEFSKKPKISMTEMKKEIRRLKEENDLATANPIPSNWSRGLMIAVAVLAVVVAITCFMVCCTYRKGIPREPGLRAWWNFCFCKRAFPNVTPSVSYNQARDIALAQMDRQDQELLDPKRGTSLVWDELFIKSLLNDRFGSYDRKLMIKMRNLQAQIEYLERENRKWQTSLVNILKQFPCLATPDCMDDLRLAGVLSQLSDLIPNRRSSRVPMELQEVDLPNEEVRYADPRSHNPRHSLLMACSDQRQSWRMSAGENE